MMVTIGGEQFELLPSGIALWPRHRMAIVADLHLEKGSHFAKRGFFIPPYDTHETLHRLLLMCQHHAIQKLMILGDCFHDAQGYHRLDAQARNDFHALLDFKPIWINGNHDGDFVPPGFAPYDAYAQDGVTFRHIATSDTRTEISGHFHPKISIVHKGATITRPCFIEDGSRLILPAFGSYTGGLSITDSAIQSLFGPAVRCHLLATEQVFTIVPSVS